MLLSCPRRSTPVIEAMRRMGTMRITASGRGRLSYWAASTRNTNTTASTKAKTAVLLARICCKARAVHSWVKPWGSVSPASCCMGAIAGKVNLGHRVFEQREDLLQARRLRGATHHGRHRCPKCLRPSPGAVLDHHAEATGGADATDRRRSYDQNEPFLDSRQLLQEGSLERGTRLPRILRTRLEWVEGDEDGPRVGSGGEGSAGEADQVDRVGNPRHLT